MSNRNSPVFAASSPLLADMTLRVPDTSLSLVRSRSSEVLLHQIILPQRWMSHDSGMLGWPRAADDSKAAYVESIEKKGLARRLVPTVAAGCRTRTTGLAVLTGGLRRRQEQDGREPPELAPLVLHRPTLFRVPLPLQFALVVPWPSSCCLLDLVPFRAVPSKWEQNFRRFLEAACKEASHNLSLTYSVPDAKEKLAMVSGVLVTVWWAQPRVRSHYAVWAAVTERLACSPPTVTNRVLYPAGLLPDFSAFVGIVPYNAAGRRVFSLISRFSRTFIPALIHAHLTHPHRLSRPQTNTEQYGVAAGQKAGTRNVSASAHAQNITDLVLMSQQNCITVDDRNANAANQMFLVATR
ncbi:hypothetical protein PR048_027019 [Dryococelus australis]|uniref:Uncharacterized protein n=1 Tax=Dryococelus australis TaxID=614101 RepID=A0ABQ9GN01_9NEOP|nr:hypothetical protein PR048_027019 [Dryococelus australis]